MRRNIVVVVAGLALCFAVACQGRVAPSSVQQGSTLVLPVGALDTLGVDDITPLGFGGTDVNDPQRGRLVARLGDASGPELLTRGSFAARQTRGGAEQILLIVDIPVDAPLGTHSIHLAHQVTPPGGSLVETPVTPGYPDDITILPGDIEVTLPDDSLVTLSGAPTPFEVFVDNASVPGGPQWEPGYGPVAVPKPRIAIDVLVDPLPQGSTERLASVSLDLSYPDGVVDLKRAFARVADFQHAWMEDDGAGAATLHGIILEQDFDFVGLNVEFGLDDAAVAILDPASLGITVTSAKDQYGNDVSGSRNVSASIRAIR